MSCEKQLADALEKLKVAEEALEKGLLVISGADMNKKSLIEALRAMNAALAAIRGK